MMETVQTVVIGAGVVGLACARRLAEGGRDVIVLEAAETIGTGTSSRNSEVIHAGIYYPKDSLKARLCVAGRQALYRYCAERGIPHRRCGKLIVATVPEEEAVLVGIRMKGEANGVTDLRWVERAEALEMEPARHCTRALLSPSTGIVDSHALMLAYQGDAESAGAMIAFNRPVQGGEIHPDGIRLRCGGAVPMDLLAQEVVVAAGLHSQTVMRRLNGFPTAWIPGQYFCKGSYFTVSGKSPFRHLIYPVPVQAGLGVHVTFDLAGGLRFGPDTEWIDSLDDVAVHEVDPARGEAFYTAIRRYYPGLSDGVLIPGYAGIRPKLLPRGSVGDDFRIDGSAEHGIAGLVCLYGIESPGLTASLAIADLIAAKMSGINGRYYG